MHDMGHHQCLAPSCVVCRLAERTYLRLLEYNPQTITTKDQRGYGAGSGAPHVMYGYLKHQWVASTDRERHQRAVRQDAYAR